MDLRSPNGLRGEPSDGARAEDAGAAGDARARADAARLGAIVVARPDGSFESLQLRWPWWLPWGALLTALFAGGEALRHRVNDWGGDSLVVALPLVLVAVVPFVVDGLAHGDERFVVHRLPWALTVIAPTVALLAHSPTSSDFAPFFMVLMSIQVGATASNTGLAVALALAACGSLAGLELAGEFEGTGIWVVGTLAGLAGGVAVRKSVEALTHEHATRATRMEKAATDERQRIAREIHDVIAHSLSVTMLHLTGARRALETDRDVDEAVEALRDAEHLGRQAMEDIRRTVGLLGADGPASRLPTPGLADVDGLVEGFRSAGLDLSYRCRGRVVDVSPATGLALYRIAQESLTNVARHAPGARAELEIVVRADHVGIEVTNGPPAAQAPVDIGSGGLGIDGMRERAVRLGGDLTAGPRERGWVVSAVVPRAATSAGAP